MADVSQDSRRPVAAIQHEALVTIYECRYHQVKRMFPVDHRSRVSTMTNLYQLMANLVLFLHVVIVLFVVLGLVLVVVGNACGWRWVNNPWFRLSHLAAIAVVVAEVWLGIVCPLTTLEMWLRSQTGGAGYSGSFIEHWLNQLLYYQAPSWVFTVTYTVFGLLVLASWWIFPPTRSR